MDSLYNIANSTILSANMGKVLTFPNGSTMDIISEILNTDSISQNDTAKFAPSLKGNTTEETLSNIWHFLKRNISYKLDQFGYQFVKTPSRTWADKFADCKSFSIFVASLLKNLNIPFKYRFVSFRTGGEYTHVYVVVPLSGKTIIMDVVMPAYNTEKPFVHKKDYDMTKIYRLSGIGEPPLKTKIIDLGPKDIGSISEGEMDLLIARDRLKTEKEIVERNRGIGSLIAEKYQDSIDMIDDAIQAVNDYHLGAIDDIDVDLALISKQASGGEYSNAKEIAGIGAIGDRKKFRANKRRELKQKREIIKRRLTPIQKQNIWEDPEISGIGKTKGFLKKVAKKVKKATKSVAKVAKKAAKGAGKVVKKAAKTYVKVAKGAVKVAKKVAKTALKVATAPLRLAAKGILEVTLPKAAPFFLYLFITDPKVLAKCPNKVKNKRKKASKVADFIVNGIGMKRPHFMGIVRNGIMKHYGKSPENVLAGMMKGIAGIGVISVAVVTALLSIIKKISSLIKKKGENVSAADAPDQSDFGEMTSALKDVVSKEIKSQPENTSALNTDSENPEQPLSPDVVEKQQEKEAEQMESGEVTASYGGGNGSSGNGTIKKSGYSSDSSGSEAGDSSSSGGSSNFESGGKNIWNSLSS